MSAIAGLYNRDGQPVAAADLERMAAPLAYRGPVGRSQNLAGAAGLLSFFSVKQQEDRHAGPLRAGRFVVAADMRLDNRAELSAKLAIGADTPDDNALLIAAYVRWGEQAPAYLLGDFAFAIWDSERREFFCARDPFGVKQLYYYCADQRFAFATEIKALLQLPQLERRLNEARLADLFLARTDDKEATLFANIFRLPPALASP